MKLSSSFGSRRNSSTTASVILAAVLICQPGFLLVSAQNKKQRQNAAPAATMSPDQRIAQVLSRLTYGARPGDFERVKAMGVEAFIEQQLDPYAIETTSLSARLRRLPTLGMATPVIIEQYTPPKPAPSPSPVIARTDNAAMPVPNLINPTGDAGKMTAAPNSMPNEAQTPGQKDVADKAAAV